MMEHDYEASSKGISSDMSAEAIAKRLRIASELHDLARVLSSAKRVGGVDPARSSEAGDAPRGPRSAGAGSSP